MTPVVSALPRPRAEACTDCARLERMNERLRSERDEAILALARERERSSTWQLEYPPTQPPARSVGRSGPPPLRHQIADFLNAEIKRRSRLHTGMKSVFAGLLATARERLR